MYGVSVCKCITVCTQLCVHNRNALTRTRPCVPRYAYCSIYRAHDNVQKLLVNLWTASRNYLDFHPPKHPKIRNSLTALNPGILAKCSLTGLSRVSFGTEFLAKI